MRLRTSLVTLCAVVAIAGVPRAALAQLGSRPAAEWIKPLESSERLAGLKNADNLARYMKPTGRIAVIEFVPGVAGHRDDPKMQLSTDQAAALMAKAGFKPVEEIKLFTDKWFVIYGKQ